MRTFCCRDCSIIRFILALVALFGTATLFPFSEHVAFAEHDEHHQEDSTTSLTSQNQVLSLTDQGLVPRILRLRKEDSIVFFLNSSSDSLATLEVDYGDKVTHCASSNMKIELAGVVRSTKPFGPRDFASMCFHDPGTYPVRAFGLSNSGKPVEGQIIVE